MSRTLPVPLALALLLGCAAPALPRAQWFPAGTEFQARYVTVDATRLRYVDAGTGPPVVLVHGVGASLYAWRHQLGPLAAAGFRVVAFDNRGFGASDKPPGGYDNASYARLLVGLMDSLRLNDAVLVGHSMGGAIAAEVALAAPTRVRGLVLIGSTGLGASEPLLWRLVRWPLLGPLLLAFRNRAFTARILRSTFANPALVTAADVEQYYAPLAEPGSARAFRAVLRAFRFDALRGRCDRIAAPTLLVWGIEDRWAPITLGRLMASEIPRVAFVPLLGVGHNVQEEAPAAVNGLIVRFLRHGLPRVPADLARRGATP